MGGGEEEEERGRLLRQVCVLGGGGCLLASVARTEANLNYSSITAVCACARLLPSTTATFPPPRPLPAIRASSTLS